MLSSDLNNKLDKVDSNINQNNNNNNENKIGNKKGNKKITISELENINYSEDSSNNLSLTTEMNNLELYLQDLSKVIQWLIESDNILINHGSIGYDVNTVKHQFQVHEVLSHYC